MSIAIKLPDHQISAHDIRRISSLPPLNLRC